MKNNYILIIFSFVFVACNDAFLEKYPSDKLNDKIYLNTAADIKLYANQFYPDIEPNMYVYKDDDCSDNLVAFIRNSYIWNESIVPQTGGGWSWDKIRSCNYALVRIANLKKTNDMLRYEAEIRFFKSFFYINLIKKFGDVPWLESDLQTNSEELYKARDSRKVVFANVLKDLDFAIANLPAVRNSGDRLTKYAALALKTEACLYEGTFRKYHGLGDFEPILREVVAAAEMVINSNLFAIYSTGEIDEDYYNLFVQDDKTDNPETIFCAVLLENIKMNNRARELWKGGGGYGYTQDFVTTYLCTDGLPISISPLYKGDANFNDQFIDRDPRMHQSVYSSNDVWSNDNAGTIEYKDLPDFVQNLNITSFFIRKWRPIYTNLIFLSKNTVDDFIFRYAETLLSYAEAKAELGECTQDVLDISINKIRDRVSMPHLVVNAVADPIQNWEIPVSALINEIRRERRIELCAEGKRWDDLVRWKAGKRIEAANTILGARNDSGEYQVIYPGYPTRKWDDKLYLNPIPKQEIALNPKLKQNPGWE